MLVIEDDGDVVNSLHTALDRLGYDVPCCLSNFQDALDRVEGVGPDIVLIDSVPEDAITGGDAAKAIRERYDVPVVCITARTDEKTDRAKEAGSCSYLVKPYDERALSGTIEMALEKHRMEQKVKKSEEKYRQFFMTSRDAVFVTSPDGQWIDFNDAAVEMFRCQSREELSKTSIAQLYELPEERLRLLGLIRENEYVFEHPVRLRRTDGSIIDVLITASSIKGDHDRIEGFIGTIRDITERKRVEREVMFNYRRQQALLQLHRLERGSIGEITDFVVEECARMTESEIAFVSYSGVGEGAMETCLWSKKVAERCAVEAHSSRFPMAHAGPWAECVRRHKPFITNDYGKTGLYRKSFPPGHFPIVRCMGVPLVAGGRVVVVSGVANKKDEYTWEDVNNVSLLVEVMWSILELKNTRYGLERSYEQIRALAAHLEKAREEERTRIAREIHDEFGQTLTGLRIDLTMMSADIASMKEDDNGLNLRLQGKTEAMVQLIDTAIHGVRRIVTELRPGILDDLGLIAAIEWQLQEFTARTGIKGTFAPALEDDVLNKEESTAVFRIFQESLTNAVRHSDATEVMVFARKKSGFFELEIADNGIGIEKVKISSPLSLGLLGMRERALSVGGECVIAKVPRKGTKVTVRIPIT